MEPTRSRFAPTRTPPAPSLASKAICLSWWRAGKLTGVPGLGKTLIARITELVTTGGMRQYDDLLERIPPGLRDMLRIPGLGPKRIRQINQALGIETLDALRAAAESGSIAALPGFGAKSQENILKGLAFVTEHQNRFRIDIAEKQAEQIASMLRALPETVRVTVAGSIRRRKETVKDADVVASVRSDADRAALMSALTSSPLVATVTGSGDTKSSVILRQGIALDLRVVLDDEFPYTLHHFTGSKEHNVALRTRLHAQGMKISEYGLFRGDELIPCTDEADIYRAIGMAYVEPELREDRGEIEAALAGELPTLVTERDIRGMLHVHSDWSDGGATIREMADATLAMGMTYLGMCDHSQVAAYANGLTPDRVKRQQEEIDRLNEHYAGRLRILKGTECDILKDGSLDYDDKTLAIFRLRRRLDSRQFQPLPSGADPAAHPRDGEPLLLDPRASHRAYPSPARGLLAGPGGGDRARGRAGRRYRAEWRSAPARSRLALHPLRHRARRPHRDHH